MHYKHRPLTLGRRLSFLQDESRAGCDDLPDNGSATSFVQFPFHAQKACLYFTLRCSDEVSSFALTFIYCVSGISTPDICRLSFFTV